MTVIAYATGFDLIGALAIGAVSVVLFIVGHRAEKRRNP